MTIIRAEHLRKHFRVLNRHEGIFGAVKDLFSNDYKVVKAVDDISFEIQAGEIVGYIGPNGAGKSTTIKMMTGVLTPTDGRLIVDGVVPYQNRRMIAQKMGVVFGQRTQLWWELPVIESFKILKEMYRVDDKTFQQQMGLFQDIVDVRSLYSIAVRNLSLGQRMLCDIVAAFLHNPKVIFLDEPTIGLDVSVKSKIRTIIKTLNRTANTTIILTTHDLSDIESLCKRIIIIDKGKIIYDGRIEEVAELFGTYRTLKVQVTDADSETKDLIESCLLRRFGKGTTIIVQSKEPGWVDLTVDQADVPLLEVLNVLMQEFSVRDVKIIEISMENVVQKIYEGGLREAVFRID